MILDKFVVIVHNLFVSVHENQKIHPLRQKVHRCLKRNLYFCFVKNYKV